MLHLIELISRLTPRRFRKRAQIVERAASEFNGFAIDHYTEYTKYCIIRQPPFAPMVCTGRDRVAAPIAE
jgi:hypothetical protein